MRMFAPKAAPHTVAARPEAPVRSQPGRSRFATSVLRSPIGNHAAARWLQAGTANTTPATKQGPAVSQPSDPLEREADRIADAVMTMRMPLASSQATGPTVQRMCAECEDASKVFRQAEQTPSGDESLPRLEEEEEKPVLHLKARNEGARSRSEGADGSILPQGAGTPLSPALRAFFEPRFGVDFSSVQVHADRQASSAAAAFNARAFTIGHHIAFGAGEYAPSGAGGLRLIAHELAHVVQQHNGSNGTPPATVHRMAMGTGATPRTNFIEVPEDERARVRAAIGIVRRVATNPDRFPGCRRFFRDNCAGGTLSTLRDVFDQAVVWKRHPNPEGWLGSTHDDSHHIAYTRVAYDVSHWAIAATLIHELIHVCGQADHGIGDQAKAVCGRLPDL